MSENEAPQYTMPQSEEGEVAVLGSILLDSSACLDECIETLTPGHFYQRRHSIIFEVLIIMAKARDPVDTVTLTTKMKDLGKLEEVGGAYYISELAGRTSASSHVEWFRDLLIEKYRLRQIIETSTRALEGAYQAQQGSLDLISSIESTLLSLNKDERSDTETMQDLHLRFLERIEFIKSGKKLGMDTGIAAFDLWLNGLCPSKYITIIAEAGVGKTSLMEQISLNLALKGNAVLIYQNDMDILDFWARMACRLAELSLFQFERGYWRGNDKYDWLANASEKILSLPIIVRNPYKITGPELKLEIRRQKKLRDIKVVFVDHVRNLHYTQKDYWEGIAQNSKALRASANESGIPHVVFNHVTLEGSRKERPYMTNIKGGGQVMDDADSVVMMWNAEARPEKLEGIDQKWKVGLGFDKNRGGGIGETFMIYNGSRMTFEPAPEVAATPSSETSSTESKSTNRQKTK